MKRRLKTFVEKNGHREFCHGNCSGCYTGPSVMASTELRFRQYQRKHYCCLQQNFEETPLYISICDLVYRPFQKARDRNPNTTCNPIL